jgi:hypothetical protein
MDVRDCVWIWALPQVRLHLQSLSLCFFLESKNKGDHPQKVGCLQLFLIWSRVALVDAAELWIKSPGGKGSAL